MKMKTMEIKNNIEKDNSPFNDNVEYDYSYSDLWKMLAFVVVMCIIFGSLFTGFFEN